MKLNLDEILERVKRASPPRCEDEDYICGICHSIVDVRGDTDDWLDDPICDDCLGEFARGARTDIPLLIEAVKDLAGALNTIRKRDESMAGMVAGIVLEKWSL